MNFKTPSKLQRTFFKKKLRHGFDLWHYCRRQPNLFFSLQPFAVRLFSMHQTKALLLRRYRFSETSFVVVWLTQEYGKVKTTARAAMKQGGGLAGRLELFSESDISFKLHQKNDLHALTEVMPSLSWKSFSPHYDTLLAASYFSELCDLALEPLHPVPEVFDLLRRAFLFLQQQAPTHRAIEHFEKELAKALGIYDPAQSGFVALQGLLRQVTRSREELLKKVEGMNPRLRGDAVTV